MRTWTGLFIGAAIGLVGCDDKGDEEQGRVEGQIAGDCVDGADNDLDGFFDCDDAGCSGSSDCGGGGGGGGGGPGGGGVPGGDDTGGGGGGPGGGGDTTDAQVTISSVAWGCDADGYSFHVETTGSSSGGWLYMYQTASPSPWNEDHPIDVSETAGAGTELYLYLESVYPNPSDVVSGSATLYDCSGTGMENTITFIIEVDDHNGNPNVDCVVWGDDPNAAPADDCAIITPDSL